MEDWRWWGHVCTCAHASFCMLALSFLLFFFFSLFCHAFFYTACGTLPLCFCTHTPKASLFGAISHYMHVARALFLFLCIFAGRHVFFIISFLPFSAFLTSFLFYFTLYLYFHIFMFFHVLFSFSFTFYFFYALVLSLTCVCSTLSLLAFINGPPSSMYMCM